MFCVKEMNNKLMLVITIVLVVGLFFVVQSVPSYASSEKVIAECGNNSYDDVMLSPGLTGLKAKGEIAHQLNEGISPDDIVLVYTAWSDVKEIFPDEAKLKDYNIKEIQYMVADLPMGSTYTNGDVLEFDEDGAEVRASYKDGGTVSYFYGENAISCRGEEEICGQTCIKYVVGNSTLYLEPNGKVPTGVRVSHISYNQHDDIFIYGLEPVSGI